MSEIWSTFQLGLQQSIFHLHGASTIRKLIVIVVQNCNILHGQYKIELCTFTLNDQISKNDDLAKDLSKKKLVVN